MITRISVDDDDEISQNYDWSGDLLGGVGDDDDDDDDDDASMP